MSNRVKEPNSPKGKQPKGQTAQRGCISNIDIINNIDKESNIDKKQKEKEICITTETNIFKTIDNETVLQRYKITPPELEEEIELFM